MTTLTDEQRRALEWQQRQKRIAANQDAANAKVAGDPAVAQRLRDNWQPVILARREAKSAGYGDPDCEDVL